MLWICLLMSVWSCQFHLTETAAVILSCSTVCDRTHAPGRPVSCLNGSRVIDQRLHQSATAICECLCIKKKTDVVSRKNVKKEPLCPVAYCFSTVPGFGLATPRLHPRWLCPSVELCYFLGCVFVLTVVLQAGRVPAAGAARACNRAAHCTGWTGCTGALRRQSEPALPSLKQTVCCHSAQKGLLCLTFVLHPSSSPLWAPHSFTTQIFRNVSVASGLLLMCACLFLFVLEG